MTPLALAALSAVLVVPTLASGERAGGPARPRGERQHVVQPGETVAKIAAASGCSIEEIRRRNGLGRSARIAAGQALTLPVCGAASRPGRPAPRAEKTHVVVRGETLGEIARRHGVSEKALMRANGIGNPRRLRDGQELAIPRPGAPSKTADRRRRLSGVKRPWGVEHRVMDGQSWTTLATAYGVPLAKLREANPTARARPIPGDVVRLPGARKVVAVPVANCGHPGVPFAKGEVRRTIRLLTCEGAVSKSGRQRLSRLSLGRGAGSGPLLHRRLLQMLQRVADEHPGRVFHVVSGYRPPGGPASESRHHHGHALDFAVEGIRNRALWELCKTLPEVGCGFYPRSTFIHLDVRETSASWVDRSGPGEPPDYVREDAAEDGPPAAEPEAGGEAEGGAPP